MNVRFLLDERFTVTVMKLSKVSVGIDKTCVRDVLLRTRLICTLGSPCCPH